MRHAAARARHYRRGGLSTILATILLIAMVVAGSVALMATWNTIFGGASSSVSLTDDGSVITVNTATDSGMILIVIKNNGPGTFNLAQVNITAATGQDVIIIPSSNTEATFGGAMTNTTGSINGGVGVGYVASGQYLTMPPGQSASFRATVASGLAELFPPDQNFQILVTPHAGTLIRLTVQSISQ